MGAQVAEVSALKGQLDTLRRELEDCSVCLAAHEATEAELLSEAGLVVSTLQESTADIALLHAKIGASF